MEPTINNNDTIKQGKSETENKKDELDVDEIFEKIAPYLTNLEFIKDFLKANEHLTRAELQQKIELELKTSGLTKHTDLRILLNSI